MLSNLPRGTKDWLPEDNSRWQFVTQRLRRLAESYGFAEIQTPILEHTELFKRGVGETSDVVSKEMYTFEDRGGRSVTLRPEGTAPVVRAYLEHNLGHGGGVVKLYYVGPMFRYGRPQAGRLRQFHQFGVEVFGTAHPQLDTEVIMLAMECCHQIGLKGLELHLNSVGCPVCRSVQREQLLHYLEPWQERLCTTCQDRLARNPLRVLDCKNPQCNEVTRSAPTTADHLCRACADHLQQVCTGLDLLEQPYQLDPFLVRGLDYYTRTAFEIMAPGIGAQNSIGGGGRYDGLVEVMGGPPTPGIGFALGLERLLLALEEQGNRQTGVEPLQVWVAPLSGGERNQALLLLYACRRAGLRADIDYQDHSLKAQLRQAHRLGAGFAVLLGQDEMARGTVAIREMATSQQLEVPQDQVVEWLISRLKNI